MLGRGDGLLRRRLGGAALVLAGLAVAGYVLWPFGDDDSGPARPPVRLVSIPELGLAFAHPTDWTRTVARRVIRLRSPDGAAIMTFASPSAGRRPKEVKAALKRELSERLSSAKVVRDGPGRLGGREVTSFEIDGRSAKERVRALALVESTPQRTYAITVLTPGRPSRKRLVEVQRILDSVRLTKPVSLRSKEQ